jgi:hypothetical protein
MVQKLGPWFLEHIQLLKKKKHNSKQQVACLKK